MGFAQVWLAAKTGETQIEELLSQLELQRTDQFEEFVSAPYVIATTRQGWSIVIGNRGGHHLVDDEKLENLSAGCEIIAGEAEEHVMVSWLSGWSHGRKIWSVSHNPEKGLQNLDVFGDPPAPFAEIRARLLEEARQAGDDGVDYLFDVPTELSRSLIGYKHDDGIDAADPTPYEVLVSTNPPRPFWKRVFGIR